MGDFRPAVGTRPTWGLPTPHASQPAARGTESGFPHTCTPTWVSVPGTDHNTHVVHMTHDQSA